MDKLLESIQDLWFDFYARLLPGIFTLAVLKYYDLLPFEVTLDQELILLVMAFMMGHFLQPWSSCWTRHLVKSKVNMDDYEKKKGSSDSLSRNIRLAEKAYAEAVGFWAVTFASFAVFITLTIMNLCKHSCRISSCCEVSENPVFMVFIGFILATLAWERTETRVRKIKRVLKVESEEKSSAMV